MRLVALFRCFTKLYVTLLTLFLCVYRTRYLFTRYLPHVTFAYIVNVTALFVFIRGLAVFEVIIVSQAGPCLPTSRLPFLENKAYLIFSIYIFLKQFLYWCCKALYTNDNRGVIRVNYCRRRI